MAVGAVVALNGKPVAHFLVALVLVGIGWNFMYTGGTTLLTESYAPAEKARTQGANDFIVFATMAVSSFSSGALVSSAGWEVMNCARAAVARRGRGRRDLVRPTAQERAHATDVTTRPAADRAPPKSRFAR